MTQRCQRHHHDDEPRVVTRRVGRVMTRTRGMTAVVVFFAFVFTVLSGRCVDAQTHASQLDFGQSMALDATHPRVGPATGGTLVALLGDGYDVSSNTACQFDKQVVLPTSKTKNVMLCLTPQHVDDRGGFVAVGLTLRRSDRDATTAPLTDRHGVYATFNFAKAMSTNVVYPSDAPEIGGEIIYVGGKHLHETASARWTKPATHVAVDVVSSALIRCESPPLTSGETSSLIIATFAASASEYDANVNAATANNQTASIPPRSRGGLAFVLETATFSLTNATSSVNVTGGGTVVITGDGFSTVGGEDDGDFLSCYFGTIGPIDARVTASKKASCVAPARLAQSDVPLRLGIGNGRFVLSDGTTIAFTETAWTTSDPLYEEEEQSVIVMSPTLSNATGAVPFNVVGGANFFIEGGGFSFHYDQGCVCTYPDGSTSRLTYVSSALVRCSDAPTWTSGEVSISCSDDVDSAVKSVYVAPVASPSISAVNALAITYQGGVSLQVEGTDYPDEGESRAYSGCHFGPIGPVNARYLTGALAECVTPALLPNRNVELGYGATESIDMVKYELEIPVTNDATQDVVIPPLTVTPTTTYQSASTAPAIALDYQLLGSLSMATKLTCTFGTNSTSVGVAAVASSVAVVSCPQPASLSPGFVTVKITRDAAAAALEPPAYILVKKDHRVSGVHPRQTWGPVDIIAMTGSEFIDEGNYYSGYNQETDLCVFAGGKRTGGRVVSSSLILCESPLVETSGFADRWITPCFGSCDDATGLPTGSLLSATHSRVSLTSMAQSHLSSIDASSGWTYGGTPVRATLSVAVASEMITCVFGTIRVQARPAGVAVVETVAAAQGENIEIDCVSPARSAGAVDVYAILAQSRAPLITGKTFTYK